MALAKAILMYGTRASQPAAAAANDGCYYRVTDEASLTEQSNGTSWTALKSGSAVVRRQVTVILDGGGAVLTTGVKAYLSLPVAGTWKKWRLLSTDSAATAGSIVIDVWKDTYANYPPAVADTITASAKPTLSSANKNESSTLTGWTTAFSAGDVLGFNVDSVATVTKVQLVLEFE